MTRASGDAQHLAVLEFGLHAISKVTFANIKANIGLNFPSFR